MLKRIFKKKSENEEYQITSLPGNYEKVAKTLNFLSESGQELINFNTDLNYVITKQGGFKMENLRYQVVELPNNTKAIELLLNNMAANGFILRFMNDYSAVFEKEVEK